MISTTLGLLVGGMICFIGVIFEEWSSKLPGAASITIVYSGILIRLMIGVFASVAIVGLLKSINAELYLITLGVMTCIVHPIVIYVKQKRK
jgi:ABC-type bacteriocin/lantibiotic exporter with double-glycine peptidase domain